jgi:hypothetical protein
MQLSAIHPEADHKTDHPPNGEARPSSAKIPIAGLLDDPTTSLAPLISKALKPTKPADFVNGQVGRRLRAGF